MRDKLQRAETLDHQAAARRTDGTIDPGHYRPGDLVGAGGVEFAKKMSYAASAAACR